MTKPTTVNDRADAPWGGLSTWNGSAMTVFNQAAETCVKACAEWQQEVSRFATARVEKDRKAQASFAECQSLADVFKLQQEWMFAAVKDYCEEGTRLTQIFSSPAQSGLIGAAQSGAVVLKTRPHAAE